MDISKALLNIIDSDTNNICYSFMAIEKLVMVMLEDYINQQNKQFMSNYSNASHLSDHRVFKYDGNAPDGFDNFEGSTAIELKIFRSIRF